MSERPLNVTPAPSHVDQAPAGDRAGKRLISSASTGTKIKRLLWAGVEATLFRTSFHTMNGWRSMLLRLFGAKIGSRCMIRRTARTYYPWNLNVGDLCVIGDKVELYSLGTITLKDRVMISQEAYICTGTHDHADIALPLVTRPIEIGADAWICARAFIGPGVAVGEGAVVAACGVVHKNVEAWSIVGGNPALFIKKRVLKPQ